MKLLSKVPFCRKTHRKRGGGDLMHFTTGQNADFSASWPNIVDWVPLVHQKMKNSNFHTAAVSLFLTPICWSMHVVIMLGSFSCSTAHYCIHICFWTFSIIAWINCMNKVSILCLNLFLSCSLAAFLQCSSNVGTRWNFFNMKYLWKKNKCLNAFIVSLSINKWQNGDHIMPAYFICFIIFKI